MIRERPWIDPRSVRDEDDSLAFAKPGIDCSERVRSMSRWELNGVDREELQKGRAGLTRFRRRPVFQEDESEPLGAADALIITKGPTRSRFASSTMRSVPESDSANRRPKGTGREIHANGPCDGEALDEHMAQGTRRAAVHCVHGIVEAAQLFDPSRKIGFAAYARHRIRGALRDFQRLLYSAGWRGDQTHAPVFRTLEKDSEEYGQVIGILPEPPLGAAVEVAEAVEQWLRKLPKAHAAVCRLIYLHGKSQEEAANLVSCSKSFVSRIHREAITWLIQDYQQACAGRNTGSE